MNVQAAHFLNVSETEGDTGHRDKAVRVIEAAKEQTDRQRVSINANTLLTECFHAISGGELMRAVSLIESCESRIRN